MAAYGMPGKRGSGLGEIHSLTLMATRWGLGAIDQRSRELERADPGLARSIRSRSWLHGGAWARSADVAASVSERIRAWRGPLAHAHDYEEGLGAIDQRSRERERAEPGLARSTRSRSWLRGAWARSINVAASLTERIRAWRDPFAHAHGYGEGLGAIDQRSRERERAEPGLARSIRSRSWLRGAWARSADVAASVSERIRAWRDPFAHAHGYGGGIGEIPVTRLTSASPPRGRGRP
jgi:hypothetical protein